MRDYSTPIPPMPSDPADAARWEHTRLRRRLLYGSWREDLDRRISQAIGAVRREAWGVPDLSSNVFRASMQSLAVLYDRRPKVSHNEAGAADALSGYVVPSGLWSLMQRIQRDTLGLREMFLRVDVVQHEGQAPEVVYRPIPPDMVLAYADPEHPDDPVEVRELRLRRDRLGRARWTYDVLCIAGYKEPFYRVISAGTDSGEDLSAEYLGVEGGLVGEAYPYRYADGRPMLPLVLYHAAKTGMLFDPYEALELVEGSLNVAVFWSMFGHVIRQASWPQRYAVGVRVPSATIHGEQENTIRESIVPDPATVLLFEPSDEGMAPQISQWDAGADPQTLQDAISMYERRLAAFAGISPSDVQRVAGDPRSGFAIAINREAAREVQRRFEPIFSPIDEELMGKTAALINRVTGGALPEEGYRVAYESLPPSAEERQSERDHVVGLISAGLLDQIEAYRQLHPGLDREDAKNKLIQMKVDEARLAAEIEQTLNPSELLSVPNTDSATVAADTALNGAQIASLLQVIGEVAGRRLPRESAVAILVKSFNVSSEAADSLLGPVGVTFFAALDE